MTLAHLGPVIAAFAVFNTDRRIFAAQFSRAQPAPLTRNLSRSQSAGVQL